jgi:hypothetical protein
MFGSCTYALVILLLNSTKPICEQLLSFPSLDPNQVPVAKCHDITMSASESSSCKAPAAYNAVDNGSYDPDDENNYLDYALSPAGPFDASPSNSSYSVTMSVTDRDGATASCTATIDVVDP